MRLLSRPEIQSALADADVTSALKSAYVSMSRGHAQLPPVGYLGFPSDNGDCHIKFGHIAGDPFFVVKVATGFYSNPARGLPTGNGLVLALSAKTGEVAAILQDGGLLTDVRTGYGGAIASEALARADARRIVIVGTGVQAGYQIRAHRQLFAARAPEFIIWGRSVDKARRLAEDLASEGIAVSVATSLEDMCRASDILVTTTPSNEPLIKADWIAAGTHITAVGADAPGKQELDPALVRNAHIRVADHAEQCLDHGEFAHANLKREQIIELGDILGGTSVGRTDAAQITIADLTGVAVQDIAIAQAVLGAMPDTSVNQ